MKLFFAVRVINVRNSLPDEVVSTNQFIFSYNVTNVTLLVSDLHMTVAKRAQRFLRVLINKTDN